MPMQVKVYQIDLKRDKDRVAFLPYSTRRPIDRSIYNKVLDGAVPVNNLEDLYKWMNLNPMQRARSMSVSDVVEKDGEFFYCDAIGFKKINF